MRHRGPAVLSALGLFVVFLVTSLGAVSDVTFIGIGFVSGTAFDKSGLDGQNICQFIEPPSNATPDCIDQATFGGFGSALAYTGFDSVFLGAADRGPFDGRTDVPYQDRVHYLHLALNMSAPAPNINVPNITTTLLDTIFLKGAANQDLVGSSSDFNQRFDPEGAAVGGDGSFYISDEYGPAILQFNRQGHLIRTIPIPSKFKIANPSGDVYPLGDGTTSFELDASLNTSGRQANRGMEGLAISPDGRYLFGLMQN